MALQPELPPLRTHRPDRPESSVSDLMSARRVVLTQSDLEVLVQWSATGDFSCSPSSDVWPEKTKGHHHRSARRSVLGELPALDRLVALYLVVHPEGGGFRLTAGVAEAAWTRSPFALLSYRAPLSEEAAA